MLWPGPAAETVPVIRFLLLLAGTLATALSARCAQRPNILWLTAEDHGPHLGCYGDAFATTPNLDALAARGLRYERVWSVHPVCAPARTAIITGRYPASLGAEPMRSLVPLPPDVRLFPQRLREAGYYCTNNQKEDYNVLPNGVVWDESSGRAHYTNRPAGAPFFAVFNFTESHESQVRRRPHTAVHDPARVPLPPQHPDDPAVRQDWAQYHDQVSAVDRRVGAALEELRRLGLAEDTVVFFWSDHGPGLPGHKRSARDAGLRVPLIVHFPEKWRALAPPDYAPGGVSRRLVSFVDLGPTVLSLAGLAPPEGMHGTAFAGPHAGPGQALLFGGRGRMDERTDLVRAVTDGRYVYVRNYLPHLPAGQPVQYMFETPTTQVWWREFRAGRLAPAQAAFWQPRPAEELYDLRADPHETNDLARLPASAPLLGRFQAALNDHLLATAQVTAVPEAHLLSRNAGGPLTAEAARVDVRAVWAAADRASRPDVAYEELARMMREGPDAVRWWGAAGCLVRGADAVRALRGELLALLRRPDESVRIAAAEALARHGDAADRRAGVNLLVRLADPRPNDFFVAVAALQALDRLAPGVGGELAPRRLDLAAFPRTEPRVSGRFNDYVGRLLDHLLPQVPEG